MLIFNKKHVAGIRNAGAKLLKIDPTRTGALRRKHLTSLLAAFARLKGEIVALIGKEDAFGLSTNSNPNHDELGRFSVSDLHSKGPRELPHTYADVDAAVDALSSMSPGELKEHVKKVFGEKTHHASVGSKEKMLTSIRRALKERLGSFERTQFRTDNTRFQFHSDPEKIKAFQRWLQQQFASELLSDKSANVWELYAKAGYKKGTERSFEDVNKQKPYVKGYARDQSTKDFYAGSKEEFLRSAFSRPVAVEKIQLLAGRSFDDLKNVTSDMSTKMSRALADGLVGGKGAKELARDLVDEVDVGRQRAEVIARTEIIRAHAEGQLDALELMGIDEVGVEVEWATARDDAVCPECSSMEGAVFSIDDARGMIPAHPNCRCCFIPVIPKEFER